MKKFLIFLIALAALTASAAPKTQLKQSLDSAYLLMGKTTTLKIEMVHEGPLTGEQVIQAKALPPQVEIADEGVTDTVSLGNNRWELRREVTLQSFDSGLYVLPPVLYIQDGETIASQTVALKVIPVPVDSLTDIHPYAPAADAGLRWYDRLPDWIVDYGLSILIALLVIAAGIFVWYRWLRKPAKGAAVERQIKKEPPYETAVRALNVLHGEHLCENGQEKEFYTRLTEILRVYLQDRFGINAMEMTSSEILHALRHNEATRMPGRLMTDILNMADFVKFAKVRPLPDDNAKTFRAAREFVEETRPMPEVPTQKP